MQMPSFVQVLLFLSLILNNSLSVSFDERSNDVPLGTKRLYEKLDIIREDGVSILAYSVEDNITRETFCESFPANKSIGMCGEAPCYVGVVTRHGARFPTSKKKDLLVSLASRVCSAVEPQSATLAASPALEWCTRVLDEVRPVRPGSLTEIGKKEMQDMGVWFTNTYLKPYGLHGEELVAANITSTRSTSYRTLQSCRNFFAGAANASVYDFEVEALCATANNDLLKPYKTCGNLQDLRKAFKETLHITPSVRSRAVQRIAERTGLNTKEILDSDDLLAAYFACQTEVATHPEIPFEESFACDLLGPFLQQFSLMEHLENYELRGFGEAVAKNLMVELLRQLTQNMEAALANGQDSQEKAECQRYPDFDLYFSHDSAVLPLAALLGIFDFGLDPYTANAARYCPFSSRLIIEVSPCGAILISYNERLVRTYKGIEEWKATYKHILDMNLKDICGHLPEFDPLIDTSAVL